MDDRSARHPGPGLVDAAGRPLVPVLTYHSVSDDPPDGIRRWSVTPARLREHLGLLRDAGFVGLTVVELLACYDGRRPLPPRPVVLTFDDGYEDFLLDAVPALSDAGYPATLYASTGLLRDEPRPARTLPGRMLDWRQLREVAAAGVEIGAHSHTHRELDTLARADARWEVEHSRRRLQDELGQPVDTFAYPYGYSDRTVRAAVRGAGYAAACGVKNAYSHADDHRWALSRILVERDLDTGGLERLVTARTLPVGWRREKPQTRAWRAYRRARAVADGLRTPGAPTEPVGGEVRDGEVRDGEVRDGEVRDGEVRAAARRALGDCVPVAVREVELARPLPPLDELTGAPDRCAHVLVRLHGHPLGVVLAVPGDALADRVTAELGDAVARHLRDDGLPAVSVLPAEGLGEPAAVPCRPAGPTRSTSVVIPTVGRPPYVLDLVRSLLAGHTVPDEILVVDNRPSDRGTAEALADVVRSDPRVRYLAEPVAGASLARNRGLRAARGELVAFLDDDVVVDPGWLAAVHGVWATTPEVGCVTGPILPAELDTTAQVLVQAYGGFDKGFAHRVFDLRDNRLDHPLFPYLVGAYGSGANAVFDREMLLRRGGFDPRLGPGTPTHAGEDLDVLLQTVLDGRAIAYEPAALVRHHHRQDLPDLRAMAHGYGVGLSALFVKHLVTNPRTFPAVVRRLPAGLTLLLRPDSTRNASRRELSYPAELTLRELAGIIHGPTAFARSWWTHARRRTDVRDEPQGAADGAGSGRSAGAGPRVSSPSP